MLMTKSMLEFRYSLLSESARLKTFKNWVFTDKEICNAKKLAEAGFYYTGTKQEPDSVQCFLCDKSLDGWEKDDDPWDEHFKHSKNCSFAKNRMTEFELTNLQMVELRKELAKHLMTKCYEESKTHLASCFEDIRNELQSLRK